MLASCAHKQEAMLSTTDQQKTDSLSLHVALMPTLGCLPIYYALRTGIADSMNLDISLLRYSAQMDIDTAIVQGHTDIAYTDLIRAIRLSDSCSVSPFLTVDEPISLIAPKRKRISKIKQMSEKMIAISRLCATDYWCDKMLDSAKISQDSVYRPQINDVKLRNKMLCTGLLEGAMLEEPYASWAILEGNKKLQKTNQNSYKFAVWVIADSIKISNRKIDQIQKFILAYKTAVNNINKGLYSDSIRSILIEEYEMPAPIADSLKIISISHPVQLQKKDVEEAMKWLNGRNALPKDFNSDSFLKTAITTK